MTNILTVGSYALETNSGGQLLAQPAVSTAAWTSATTVNTALSINTVGYSTVVLSLNQGTTITGGVLTFEVSDSAGFTNAYGINGSSPNNTSTNWALTYGLVASTNRQWVFNVSGCAAFRVRLSTIISGTATVNLSLTASTAMNPINVGAVAITSTGTIIPVGGSIAQTAVADNLANVNFFGNTAGNGNPLDTACCTYGGAYSGTASAGLQGWSKERAPTTFKISALVTSAAGTGATAIWAPATGNKFRLQRLVINASANCSLASAGILTIAFADNVTAMPIAFDFYVPGTAVTTTGGCMFSQVLDLGKFGIVSAASNNVLSVLLGTALATGSIRISAQGTEE